MVYSTYVSPPPFGPDASPPIKVRLNELSFLVSPGCEHRVTVEASDDSSDTFNIMVRGLDPSWLGRAEQGHSDLLFVGQTGPTGKLTFTLHCPSKARYGSIHYYVLAQSPSHPGAPVEVEGEVIVEPAPTLALTLEGVPPPGVTLQESRRAAPFEVAVESPQSLSAPVELGLKVGNNRGIIEKYTLHIEGIIFPYQVVVDDEVVYNSEKLLDNGAVPGLHPSVKLDSQEAAESKRSKTAYIVLSPLREKMRAGRYEFTVAAQATDSHAIVSRITGAFVITPKQELDAQLTPKKVSIRWRRRGQFKLDLKSYSNHDVELRLNVEKEDDEDKLKVGWLDGAKRLRLDWEHERIAMPFTVGISEQASVPVVVKPPLYLVGPERHYRFGVTATPLVHGARGEKREAILAQKPALFFRSWWPLILILLLLALIGFLLWASSYSGRCSFPLVGGMYCPAPPQPVIKDYTTDLQEVNPGDSAMLKWLVKGAKYAWINDKPVQLKSDGTGEEVVSPTVAPGRAQEYKLCISGKANPSPEEKECQFLQIKVATPQSALTISDFSSDAQELAPGERATLSWRVKGAKYASLNGKDVTLRPNGTGEEVAAPSVALGRSQKYELCVSNYEKPEERSKDEECRSIQIRVVQALAPTQPLPTSPAPAGAQEPPTGGNLNLGGSEGEAADANPAGGAPVDPPPAAPPAAPPPPTATPTMFKLPVERVYLSPTATPTRKPTVSSFAPPKPQAPTARRPGNPGPTARPTPPPPPQPQAQATKPPASKPPAGKAPARTSGPAPVRVDTPTIVLPIERIQPYALSTALATVLPQVQPTVGFEGPLTRGRLDQMFGEGNWGCAPRSGSKGIVVKNVPPNFVVPNQFELFTQGTGRFKVSQPVPTGKATGWLYEPLPDGDCRPVK